MLCLCLFHFFLFASCTVLLICLFFLIPCSHRCCFYFLWKGYELSGEIALKNNNFYHYYYYNLPTSITMGNTQIPFKQSSKNLGSTFDCHPTMFAHVSNIARTCYIELHRLASIRRFLTSTATATLVSAFVLSRIDYCNSLLFGSTHDVTSHLQRIQNYAAGVILHLPKSSTITTHLRSLHWFPVNVSSTYEIACLCYHWHSSTAPSYVTDMLHRKPSHTRTARFSAHTMPLPKRHARIKATLGDRSFSFVSSVWNSIPNDVRCAPSLSSLKSCLKTYLFRSVYKDWAFSLITVHMCMVWPCHSIVDILS